MLRLSNHHPLHHSSLIRSQHVFLFFQGLAWIMLCYNLYTSRLRFNADAYGTYVPLHVDLLFCRLSVQVLLSPFLG